MNLPILQRLLARWEGIVFRGLPITPKIRALRLLEEALEYSQAENVTEDEVALIIRQVYDRAPGQPSQEIAGVLVCSILAANRIGHDAEQLLLVEFERIMTPEMMEKIRRRNINGEKIGFEPCPLDQLHQNGVRALHEAD